MVRYIFSLFEGKYKKMLRTYMVTSLVSPIADLFSLSVVLLIMNDVVKKGEVTPQKLYLTFGMVGVTLCKACFELYRNYLSNEIVYHGSLHISVKLYDLIMSESLLKHSGKEPMQAVAQVRDDTSACVSILLNTIGIVAGSVSIVGYAVIFIFYAHLMGVVVFIALFLFMAYIYLINRKRILQYGEKRRLLAIKNNSQITTGFGAFKEMKIDDRSRFLLERFENTGNELAKIQSSFSFKSGISGVALREGIMLFLFLFLGFFMAFAPDVVEMMATLVIYIGVLIKMVPGMQRIVSSLNSIDYAKHSYEILKENLASYEEIVALRKSREGLRKRKLSFQKGLKVEGLSFGYHPAKRIFENACIEIPSGSCVGIIGASGSGKTTFLDLILGLLEAESGSIRYDDYDVVTKSDHEGVCEASLGDIVSYIPQVVYLNGETIKHNVAFFDEDEKIDEEKVKEVLRCAQIYDDVMEMPDGIDSMIGQNGTTISGGQRQRIALARALYKDFEILIMDEATAALDMETEKAVIDSIREIKGNKTLLMVTHHKSLADECDIVYKIENKGFVRIR